MIRDTETIFRGQPVTLDATSYTFATGTKGSRNVVDRRYDLIPLKALDAGAAAMAEGAHKYGETNWQSGCPEGVNACHAVQHLLRWLHGDRSEDHLGHAFARVCMELHWAEPEASGE